jgi:hypothetical protein
LARVRDEGPEKKYRDLHIILLISFLERRFRAPPDGSRQYLLPVSPIRPMILAIQARSARWGRMKRSIARSASVFAALCLSAEAHSVEIAPPAKEAVTLSEKLQAIRRLPPPSLEWPTFGVTPVQWFNWNNWSNCTNGQWRNC